MSPPTTQRQRHSANDTAPSPKASAAAIEAFLARTYQLVPDGQESAYPDFDAELAELLSQA